ncbi:uncharacterized protein LOC110178152 isoform X1 [Drosophila serrata]|uniref:uncharacterized protein LOC110178152 isoform X1 n=1 Tax=Drosophila serrata TaxID=7274 RepID=UPI000A1CF913|nr:uncharacterized protein LOC110178152 isoform X1 [Drosophila serrata]
MFCLNYCSDASRAEAAEYQGLQQRQKTICVKARRPECVCDASRKAEAATRSAEKQGWQQQLQKNTRESGTTATPAEKQRQGQDQQRNKDGNSSCKKNTRESRTTATPVDKQRQWKDQQKNRDSNSGSKRNMRESETTATPAEQQELRMEQNSNKRAAEAANKYA